MMLDENTLIMFLDNVFWSCEGDQELEAGKPSPPATALYDEMACEEDACDISCDWYIEYDADPNTCADFMLTPDQLDDILPEDELPYWHECNISDAYGRNLRIWWSYEKRQIIACRGEEETDGEELSQMEKDSIAADAEHRVARDGTGISHLAYTAGCRMKELLYGCRVYEGTSDAYTKKLVRYYLEFAPDMEGGSAADCAASHCVDAMNGYILNDADEYLVNSLCKWIDDYALYPQREYDALREAGVLN